VVSSTKTLTTAPEGLAGAVVAVASRHAETDLDSGSPQGLEETKNEGRAGADGAMTEVKMELVGSAPPVPTQGAMSGYAMMPCAPGQGFDRAGMDPAQQTTDRGGAPTGGMEAGPMRGEMSKSAGGISAMMPTMTAADMMLPRVASPPVDDTDPR
jgi:hypothetical protein